MEECLRKNMIIQNEELKNLLLEKEEVIKKGREIARQIEDLQNDHQKLILEVGQLKDKIVPIVLSEIITQKYEAIRTVEVINDEIVVNIVDIREELKQTLDKSYEEEMNKYEEEYNKQQK